MRTLGKFALAILLVLAVASPGLAGVAAIQATAPLQDHSEQAITMAFKAAVATAMRGAVAMGLPWVQVRQAVVLEDIVVVKILATDTKPDGGQTMEPEPGGEPGERPSQPDEHEL